MESIIITAMICGTVIVLYWMGRGGKKQGR